MPRLRACLVVLGLVMSSAAAQADGAASYAYLTDSTSLYHENNDSGHTEHACKVTGLVPRAIVDHRPAGPAPELLQGATTFTETISDGGRSCGDYVHTWQRVTFGPGDASQVFLVLPRRHYSWLDDLIRFGLVVLLACGVVYGVGQVIRALRAPRGGRR